MRKLWSCFLPIPANLPIEPFIEAFLLNGRRVNIKILCFKTQWKDSMDLLSLNNTNLNAPEKYSGALKELEH